MRIDKTETIAGQPILGVRDFLRSIGDNGFTELEIAHRFKVSQGGAAEIMRELRARSWVEPREEHEPGWYEVSMRGRALAAARAVAPISRMAAELLMKRFLERVSDVNGRDELTHHVTEVRVFGSYLSSSEDLGDIDLAVELRFRNIPGRDPIKYNEERAEQSGKRFRSWFEMVAYGESEVHRLLKQRSPYISLHPLSDIAGTGSESKVVFVAECEK